MSYYGLWKPRSGEVIKTRWGQLVVDALDDLHNRVSGIQTVFSYGYLVGDIIPDKDIAYLVGNPNARIKEVHSGYGYFTYDCFISGKRVLKDGDPIYIADLYHEARVRITEAIDYAYITQYTSRLTLFDIPLSQIEGRIVEVSEKIESIYAGYSLADIYSRLSDIETRLETLIDEKKPKLLGLMVDYYAPEFIDIFESDLVVQGDGKVRIKITGDRDFYGYLKWIPAGLTQEVISLLNEGRLIPRNAWKEFDFTVMKNDKVNVRVSPSTKVTVAIYNIFEA